VEIALDSGMTQDQMGAALASRQGAIKDLNPDVESVIYDANNGELIITFKAASGDIADGLLAVSDPDGIIGAPTVTPGDNSYQGVYQLYAYLNGEELLDIGKVVDPGDAGFASQQSEVGPVLITFDPTSGLLNSINGQQFLAGGSVPGITIAGADPANAETEIRLDLSNTTQFASTSIVKTQSQDGYTKGDLVGVSFGGNGEMIASFSNGQNQQLGVVAIATFENQAGLRSSGGTEWTATLDSGSAIINPPGAGLSGSLRSAALEQSNVDLSAELVRLIEAQRNFQANSKTLETLNTVTQTILQI
jgi:flagellar hook protein FlgE